MVRVVYYIHQAPRTFRALLGSLRFASKSWSLLTDEGEGAAHAWDDPFDAEGAQSEEHRLLMVSAL